MTKNLSERIDPEVGAVYGIEQVIKIYFLVVLMKKCLLHCRPSRGSGGFANPQALPKGV